MEMLTAVFHRESYRFTNDGDEEDIVIVDCKPIEHVGEQETLFLKEDQLVQVRCPSARVDDFRYMLTYKFYGQWGSYTNKRTKVTKDQFQAVTFVATNPHGKRGTLAYLEALPGVGRKITTYLWEEFGSQAIEVLREHPEVAREAINKKADRVTFSIANAKLASLALKEAAAAEKCEVDLLDALSGRGFPKGTAKSVKRKWGTNAGSVIKKNPYKLLRFKGCGFPKTDAMYLDLGLPSGWFGRQVYAAVEVVSRERDGSTWISQEYYDREIRRLIGSADLKPVQALISARRHWLRTRRDADNNLWIALRRNADAEASLALTLGTMARSDGRWPDISELDISDHQREELEKATAGQVGIFRGSPGTGKTYTSARLIKKILEKVGEEKVAIVAFTNKAAGRLNEAMSEYGVPPLATTIHKALGTQGGNGGFTFNHHKGNRLGIQYLIVDEMSMNGTSLTASLFEALPHECNVMLLGDTNQLPPVEHGAPLRDVIKAGLPTGSLTEIQRNSGMIVQACASIRDNCNFKVSAIDLVNGGNLGLLLADDAESITARIMLAVGNLRAKTDANLIRDVQVITATNKLRHELNSKLQRIINPSGQAAKSNPFRVDDRVVSRETGQMSGEEELCRCGGVVGEDSCGCAKPKVLYPADGPLIPKGEVGYVTRVEPGKVWFSFPQGECRMKVPGKSVLEKNPSMRVDLAYAMTCHYLQGSECPIVFVALDPSGGAKMVSGKEWLITAISRAKRVCYLVGKKRVADQMCLRERLSLRKTFLAERLEEYV